MWYFICRYANKILFLCCIKVIFQLLNAFEYYNIYANHYMLQQITIYYK